MIFLNKQLEYVGDNLKQAAHAWVALRALKMIDDWGEAPQLTEMLSYYLSDVWDGAWLPDIRICDMRYGHIYKMDSDPQFIDPNLPTLKKYIKSYKDLKKSLVGKRLTLNYIKDLQELKKPYRSHVKEGGHLPNRVIAISHSIGDMLKLSDFPLRHYTQKRIDGRIVTNDSSGMRTCITERKIRDLGNSPNFSARQIALSFFLLSHYITDAHMPLHCDLRDLSVKNGSRRLPSSLHKWIEKLWDQNFPAKKHLMPHRYTKESLDEIVLENFPKNSIIEIDNTNSKYSLSKKVNKNLKGDEWTEMIYTTRVSYAVARKWIPKEADWDTLKKNEFPKYRDFKNKVLNETDFGDGSFAKDFKHITNCIFHDSVEAVARIWFKAWQRFIE